MKNHITTRLSFLVLTAFISGMILSSQATYSQGLTGQIPDAFAEVDLGQISDHTPLEPALRLQPMQDESEGTGTDDSGMQNRMMQAGFQGLPHYSPTTTTNLPPDVTGAAGPAHLMAAGNWINVQDKSTGARFLWPNGTDAITLSSFWSSLNSPTAFKPRLAYDPYFQRWIFTAAANSGSANSSLLIAVSRTSNPLGLWYTYRYDYDASNQNWMNDPAIGFNNKWICISVNAFNIATNGFVKSELFVFNKANLYTGAASPGLTRLGTLTGSYLMPAITYDNETNTPLYLMSVSSRGNPNLLQPVPGSIRIHTITGNTSSPIYTATQTYSAGTVLSGFGWTSTGPGAPQLGSSVNIDTGDDRIQKVIYSGSTLYGVHTVYVPTIMAPLLNSRTDVQWWRINLSNNTATRGTIGDATGGYHYAYPSVDFWRDLGLSVIIGYTRFSSTTYASAGRSTLYGDTAIYKSGESSYVRTIGGVNRWGSYSTVCRDPETAGVFILQQYAGPKYIDPITSTNFDTWGTWWSNLPGPDASGQIARPKNSVWLAAADINNNRVFYYEKIQSFSPGGPGNIRYASDHPLSTTSVGGVTNVSDIKITPDFAYVLDGSTKRVYRTSVTGTSAVVSKTLLTNAGQALKTPTGIEVKGDSLYILDKGLRAIFRYPLTAAFFPGLTINASQRINLLSANSRAESLRLVNNCVQWVPNEPTPSLYVLDDNNPRRVFSYSLGGTHTGTSNPLQQTAFSSSIGNATGMAFYVYTSIPGRHSQSFTEGRVGLSPYNLVISDRTSDKLFYYNCDDLFNTQITTVPIVQVLPLQSRNINCTGIDNAYDLGTMRMVDKDGPEPSQTLMLQAHPNPTDGLLNLTINRPLSGETFIQIYDLMGRLVNQYNVQGDDTPMSTIQIDLLNQTAGSYLVAVINGVMRKTLIVQKQ